MSRRLHARIFFPALLVLLIFPILALTVFAVTADGYFRNMAQRNTSALVRQVRRSISEGDAAGENAAENTAGENAVRGNAAGGAIGGRISRILRLARENNGKTSLLMIDTNLSLTYPEASSAPENIRSLYEECRRLLENGDFPAHEDAVLTISDGSYAVSLLESAAFRDVPDKYIVCYSSIPDTVSLLASAWKLLAGVAVFCLLISAVLIWLITKSIVRPIETLCRKAEAIGEGDYTPVSGQFATEELEMLKTAINRMAGKLKEGEERTLSFFQNASHDLKTPLVSISGYAQGIQCGVLEEPQKAAGVILRESQRMTELVESILTISKLDSRSFTLQMVPVWLDEFIYEQIEIFQGSLNGRRLSAPNNLPSVCIYADARLLIRVFQNVVSNCLRYAGEDVFVNLRLTEDKAEITVEDDGPGISKQDMPHIFARFYKGKGGNVGLGLSIVRSGMEYMNGSVHVENKAAPLHGAVYRLTFPVAEEGEQAGNGA